MYTRITQCRSCQSTDLQAVLSLGNQYVVDFVEKPDATALRAPLTLVKCGKCHLLQLEHSVDPQRLFTKFWYRSGISESMRESLRDVVGRASTLVNLDPRDAVLDIGSNDGTMLSLYGAAYKTVGIDPCKDLVKEAIDKQRQDVGIAGFFNAKLVKKFGPFKIITAVAMFYDLEDPVTFLKDCKQVLHDDGVLVVQMNYLKMMLENMAFDNISHEHLGYYSVMAMRHLVNRCGLDIAGVSLNGTNGGSIRFYIVHSGKQLEGYRSRVAERVALSLKLDELIHDEVDMRLDTVEPYKQFEANIQTVVRALKDQLARSSHEGKTIYAYGASTRGTALLQCIAQDWPLDASFIKGVAERDANKFGRYMVGSWLPIVSEEEARKNAQVFLLLPYHFWEAIRRREKQWIDSGGEFIVPLPLPFKYSSEGAYNLITGRNTELAEVTE